MSLLQTMLCHLDLVDKQQVESSSTQEDYHPHVSEPELFVSTDLDSTEFAWAVTAASDIEHNGKMYRRLDPEYFGWLRSRLVAAHSAYQSGKLPDAAWENLRSRFNALQVGQF